VHPKVSWADSIYRSNRTHQHYRHEWSNSRRWAEQEAQHFSEL